jgi:Flp pilus assembly protein TadD
MAMIQKALKLSPGDLMAIDLRAQADPGSPSSSPGLTPEACLQESLDDYRQKQYPEAVLACEQALKLRPDYAEAWNNIGAACNELGLYEKAAAALNTALLLKPDFPLARNNLNYARMMAEKQKQSRP